MLPFKRHPSYGVCVSCGCYVNRCPPLSDEIESFYSLNIFWQKQQRLKGLPTIEKRGEHYRADGRLEYWLKLVSQYGPSHGRVIEVGCAPGILLSELENRGYECIGVEAHRDTADWLKQQMKLDVRAGIFPDIELPSCDLFLAFDVLEHSSDPLSFMRKAAQLLIPGGVAIIQTCVDRSNETPPFGKRFKDAFDDIEHLFLFTDKAMRELARLSSLEVVSSSDGLWVMGEIYVFRKPQKGVA